MKNGADGVLRVRVLMKKSDILKAVSAASEESGAALKSTVARLAPDIGQAAQAMADSIRSGGKVLVCGNGGSAADAQHLAGEMVGRFLLEREPLAAIALSTDTSVITCIANDYGFDAVFERQVSALGGKNDVLVAISTSGNSPNVLKALGVAGDIGMKTVGLTGRGGGKMAATVAILIDVDSDSTPRIQEVHGFIIHMLCALTEQMLCGNDRTK